MKTYHFVFHDLMDLQSCWATITFVTKVTSHFLFYDVLLLVPNKVLHNNQNTPLDADDHLFILLTQTLTDGIQQIQNITVVCTLICTYKCTRILCSIKIWMPSFSKIQPYKITDTSETEDSFISIYLYIYTKHTNIMTFCPNLNLRIWKSLPFEDNKILRI